MLQRERQKGKRIGFVPTMGALHAGHLSLVRVSKRENDVTVVSIFVNPTQFGPKEDYKKYPRVLRSDKKMLRPCMIDYLFCPSVSAMYPEGFLISPASRSAKWPFLANELCGKFRPGHFQGVVKVVTRLLNMVGPCRLYLGAKDYQQARVITQLVKDLNFKVNVSIMPTVREKDGLAMSSRNRYLTSPERRRARMISKILQDLRVDLIKKKGPLSAIRRRGIRELKKYVDRVQYLEIVDPKTLKPLARRKAEIVVLTACFVGKTRLIDNVIILSHKT